MKVLIFLPAIIILFMTAAADGIFEEHDIDLNRMLRTADSLYNAKEYTEAIDLGRSIVGKAGESLPDNDSALAKFYGKFGIYLCAGELYDEAEVYLEEALEIRKDIFGPDHPQTARSVYELGRWNNLVGNHEISEQLLRRALAIRLKILDPDDLDLAFSYAYLSLVCRNQNRLSDAEEYIRKSIEIRLSSDSEICPEMAKNHTDLGIILARQGRYYDAYHAHRKSLTVVHELYRPDSLGISVCLANLGQVSVSQGNYLAAEEYLRDAIAIKQKIYGPTHTDVALNLSTLGWLYCNVNNYPKAEELFIRVLEIYRNELGEDHPAFAQTLQYLGVIYHNMENYTSAEEYLQRSMDITIRFFGENHLNEISCLLNLANVYVDNEKYDQADSLLLKALSICRKLYPECHPTTAEIMNSIGLIYLEQGEYDKSIALIDSAYVMRSRLFGSDHSIVAESYESISDYHRRVKNFSEAFEFAKKACRLKLTSFNENALCMPENDALKFSNLFKKSVNKMLTCFFELDSPDSEIKCAVADIILGSKGQVSDHIFERRRAIAKEDDPDIIALVNQLKAARFRLSRLYIDGENGSPEIYKSRLDSLRSITDSLDNELSHLSDSYHKQKNYQDISYNRIAALLPEKSTLIEYLVYEEIGSETVPAIPHYLAVICTADRKPAIVDLGDVAGIDRLIDRYVRHMFRMAETRLKTTIDDMNEYGKICRGLYDKIWKPIGEYLADREMLIVAPDGNLNSLAFAGLIDSSGKYLIESHLIHYLSAGRDILRFDKDGEVGSGLYAMGGPDYDAPPFARVEGIATQIPEDVLSHYHDINNNRSGCGKLNEVTLKPLPGSLDELEMINGTWQNSSNEPTIIRSGIDATEDNFKAEAPGFRIIHLCTHAYFLEGACNFNYSKSNSSNVNEWAGENPLLLSGLFLAGANLHGQGADNIGIEDGILTALEVSEMDLDGTEIVILSACETGLGRIRTGEGAYGLRRAFQMAGARTVISTLWPISDVFTADLFNRLYERSEIALPEAMRQVQLSTLKELRAANIPDHPVDWAPFVIQGDWR